MQHPGTDYGTETSRPAVQHTRMVRVHTVRTATARGSGRSTHRDCRVILRELVVAGVPRRPVAAHTAPHARPPPTAAAEVPQTLRVNSWRRPLPRRQSDARKCADTWQPRGVKCNRIAPDEEVHANHQRNSSKREDDAADAAFCFLLRRENDRHGWRRRTQSAFVVLDSSESQLQRARDLQRSLEK